MSEQKDLETLKKKLIVKYPRFASQIANIEIEFKTNLKFDTAATDGKKIYFSPNFVKSQPEDVLLFVLAHEVMHIKFRHHERKFDKNGNERDKETWNIATDAIINANLERDGLKGLEDVVRVEGALNFTSEELYELIYDQEKNKQEQNEQSNEGGDGSGNPPDENGDHSNNQANENSDGQNDNKQNGNKKEKLKITGKCNDDHSMWNKDKEKTENKDQQNGNGGKKDGKSNNGNGEDSKQDDSSEKELSSKDETEDKSNDNSNPSDNKSSDDDQTDDKNSNCDQFGTSSKNAGHGDSVSELRQNTADPNETINEKAEFQKNREQKIGRMQSVFEKVKSQISTKNEKPFGYVGEASHIVDWKVLLRRELEKNETVWSQRRSIAENNYAYRLEEFDVDEESTTEVLLDTSGSVPNRLIMQFLRALKPLAKQSKLKVATFDDDVHLPFVEIKKMEDIDNFHIKGSGGTNFNNAVLAFSKDPKVNKIVFTDGYANLTRDYKYLANVIWLVYGNRKFDPPLGKVIQVSEEAIDNLQNTNWSPNNMQNYATQNNQPDETSFER